MHVKAFLQSESYFVFQKNDIILLSVEGTSASFGKSSLKHAKSFRIISSNQKLARALTSTQLAVARTNTSCRLATSGTKTAGSVTSRRSDRAIKVHQGPSRSIKVHQGSTDCYNLTPFTGHEFLGGVGNEFSELSFCLEVFFRRLKQSVLSVV